MTLAVSELASELEHLRVGLTGFCYRMLGSAADADDAVQETFIRALSAADRFDPRRAALTTWVHRIATNICLDMLRAARRRALPMPALSGGGSGDPSGQLGAPLPAEHWVEPMPDHRLVDPADIVSRRETIRIGFVALLQTLPPRQRAVLVLRDVLRFSAAETADILDATVSSVTSALQRARATVDAARPMLGDLNDPADADQRSLLDRYIAAFESHDVEGLIRLLHDDASTSMPPFEWWVEGAARIAALVGLSEACAQDRLVPTVINGCPGFGQYRPAPDGVLRPFGLVMVLITSGRIAHLMTFLDAADRFAEFGLPEILPSDR